MKYININKLADEQYEDLSDFIDNRLSIYDQMGQQVEYTVEDLKVDEIGIVYAPTEAFTYEESDNSGFVPTGGLSEMRTELKGYEPTKFIIKNQ